MIHFLFFQSYFRYIKIIQLFSFLGLLSLQSLSSAPLKKIIGKVINVENNQTVPVQYATVRLLSSPDSIFVSGTTSDEDGFFEFNRVKDSRYFVMISCVGFQNKYELISVAGQNPLIKMGDIRVNENSVSLGEATVIGKLAEMKIMTDTVEYNATAYKLNENAVVEDLLKRLPGITITEDGKILVNGKEVKKVMVDGKDFFRSNPNLSIKNIPAGIMDKLQIIDDKSELSKLTGVDDGEENTTINITIQKDKKKGWLVNSNIGAGQELDGNEDNLMRYSVNTFAARLKDESQLGIVANGNNINGMNVGSGGSTIGSGKPGLNTSISGGVNFSSGKDKESPWVFNGDISYGFNESVLHRNSRRAYFLQDSTSYQKDSINQVSREDGIRFSGKIESRLLSGWTFSLSPSASYSTRTQTNNGNSLLQAGNIERDSVNYNQFHRFSKTPTFELGGTFTVSHDFEKKRRKLSLSLDSRYSNSEATGETQANYIYYRRLPENREVNRNQQWTNQSNSFSNRMYLSYIEPFGEKSSVQFVYWIKLNDRENLKNSYKPDTASGEYSVLDLPYSRSIENTTLTQQLGLSYRSVVNKMVYRLGFDYNPAYIRSRSFIQQGSTLGMDSTITYFPGVQNFNYAPNAYMLYNMGKGKNMRFDYRGRSDSPSINQLDPSRDETNPSYIRVGNPDLLPRFTHWIRLRYNNSKRETQQSIMLNVEANFIENDIVNFTDYDGTTGVKTTRPVNQSGSWNANGMLMYNRPLSKKFQINNYSKSGVRNNIGFSTLNGKSTSAKTIATTVSFNEDLGLTFKWEWLYLMTKASYEWNNTTYSVASMLSKQTSEISTFITSQISLPGSFNFSSNLNYRSLSGFSSDYSLHELLWNINVSKSFMKNKAATVSIMLNDILQQQLSITQNISSNYVEDQQFNTLKSFVMVVFSYKFNTMGATTKTDKKKAKKRP